MSLLGFKHTEETKRKMSESHKGKPLSEEHKRRIAQRGFTEEHRRRISESKMGHFVSEETRKKLSIINNGKKLSPVTKQKIHLSLLGNKHTFGKKLSKEHKLKLSQALSGKKHPLFGKHHSEETKTKMSFVRLGKTYEQIYGIEKANDLKKQLKTFNENKNPFWGRNHSKETKKMLSEKKKKWFLENPQERKKLSILRMKQIIPFYDTSIERKMQEKLRENGIPFVTHKPITGQPDIFIEPNLCVFCDGDYWHCNPNKYREPISINQIKNKERDIFVNSELSKQGYMILRFWENEINNDIHACFERIRACL